MRDDGQIPDEAERIELPGGYAMQAFHSTFAKRVLYRLVQADGESVMHVTEPEARAFAAAMSATTSRPSAKMGDEEVDRLIFDLRVAAGEAEVAALSDHISGDTFAELVSDLRKAENAVKDAYHALATKLAAAETEIARLREAAEAMLDAYDTSPSSYDGDLLDRHAEVLRAVLTGAQHG